MCKVLSILCLLCLSSLANAFTAAERTILNLAINAEPSMAACVAANDDACATVWFNTLSTFVVWRTNVPQSEYQGSTSASATNFDWAGTGGFISRSQAERDAWRTLFAQGSVDPSKTNVRAAFDDIFSGTGAGAINNRAHLAATSKRLATNAEKAFATGTGTTLSPGFAAWEGEVTINDTSCILRGCP